MYEKRGRGQAQTQQICYLSGAKTAATMFIKSRGIALHTIKYNDTQIICHVLTEQAGCIPFIVRVSRSPRAAVRHTLFQPMTLLELEWNERAGDGLRRPKAAQTAGSLSSVPYDPGKAAIALFLSEFLFHAVRGDAASPLLFGYVYRSVEWLDTCRGGYANFHLVFLLRLARFLGFEPNVASARTGYWFDLEAGRFVPSRPFHPHFVPPEEARRLPTLLRMDFATMRLFRFSGAERSRLLEQINTYYRLHIPGFPELKSLAVLRSLFSSSAHP